jgi:hypothetical protein
MLLLYFTTGHEYGIETGWKKPAPVCAAFFKHRKLRSEVFKKICHLLMVENIGLRVLTVYNMPMQRVRP